MTFDNPITLEASGLGWTPGQYAQEVIHDGDVYKFYATSYTSHAQDILGWRYLCDNGCYLLVIND